MSFSRRKFLRAGTMVAIAAGLPSRTLLAETLGEASSLIPPSSHLRAGQSLDRQAFTRCLNTKFAFVHGDAQPATVKLIEVSDLTRKAEKAPAQAAGKECFAAVFIGSLNAPLRQETYAVTHESLGKFSMLVVPIASKKDGIYYEAIFNRLH